MPLRIGDDVPNFTAQTTQGTIDFHEWIGESWAILFSHPKDFTPVCTTELGYMAGLKPEFDKRNCKIIGLSIDSVSEHEAWSRDIEETQGHAVNYPIIGDTTHGRSEHNIMFRKEFGIHRLLLQAMQVTFPHPVSGEQVTVTDSLDSEFEALFARLGWEAFSPQP